jgi:hypothetical protein
VIPGRKKSCRTGRLAARRRMLSFHTGKKIFRKPSKGIFKADDKGSEKALNLPSSVTPLEQKPFTPK